MADVTPTGGDLEGAAAALDGLLGGAEPGASEKPPAPQTGGQDGEEAEGLSDTSPSPDSDTDGDTEDIEASAGDAEEAGEDDGEPPIDAPAAWTTEEKAEFQKLPPEVQTAVLRREQDRERGFQQKSAKLDTDRKSLEDAQEQARAEWNKRLEAADALLVEAGNAAVGPSEQIDWEKLRLEDPDQYLMQREMQRERQERLQSIEAKRREVQQQQQQDHQQRLHNYLQDQASRLAEQWPAVADPEKGPKLKQEIADYALGVGFTQQEIGRLIDHRQVLTLRKAMLYDRLQKKNPEVEKKLRTAPKMVRPGASQDRKTSAADQHKKAVQNLRRNPKSRDTAADAFQTFLDNAKR